MDWEEQAIFVRAGATLLILRFAGLFGPDLLLGQPDATISVHCRLVDDINRAPVARARLTLSGGKLEEPLVAYTDDQGGCPFSKLPAGRYSLRVEKAGYFSFLPGPGAGGKPIIVDAQNLPGVDLGDIVLVRMRNISGFIRWQSGDPADHIVVHALLVRRGKAAFRAGDARLFPTNE